MPYFPLNVCFYVTYVRVFYISSLCKAVVKNVAFTIPRYRFQIISTITSYELSNKEYIIVFHRTAWREHVSRHEIEMVSSKGNKVSISPFVCRTILASVLAGVPRQLNRLLSKETINYLTVSEWSKGFGAKVCIYLYVLLMLLEVHLVTYCNTTTQIYNIVTHYYNIIMEFRDVSPPCL